MLWLHLSDVGGDHIKVHLKIDTPHKVEITDYVLVPGYVNEYSVLVTADAPGTYDLAFSFVENGYTNNILKENLFIMIEYDGVLYRHDTLENLYEDNFVLRMDLKRLKGKEIKITYYIPEYVGNEIQGSVVDFDLFITAKELR